MAERVFQSTRPIRGATSGATYIINMYAFQSTRPIRGATFVRNVYSDGSLFQSTRPIRGATFTLLSLSLSLLHFNPRAPYGARQRCPPCSDVQWLFQSTRPIRGATRVRCAKGFDTLFQSTRPIRGATTRCWRGNAGRRDFNPRAPYGARQQKCIIYVLHFCNNRQSKHKNQQETSSVRTFF